MERYLTTLFPAVLGKLIGEYSKPMVARAQIVLQHDKKVHVEAVEHNGKIRCHIDKKEELVLIDNFLTRTMLYYLCLPDELLQPQIQHAATSEYRQSIMSAMHQFHSLPVLPAFGAELLPKEACEYDGVWSPNHDDAEAKEARAHSFTPHAIYKTCIQTRSSANGSNPMEIRIHQSLYPKPAHPPDIAHCLPGIFWSIKGTCKHAIAAKEERHILQKLPRDRYYWDPLTGASWIVRKNRLIYALLRFLTMEDAKLQRLCPKTDLTDYRSVILACLESLFD